MKDLFWTTLIINNRPSEYHIVFENEAYCFIPKETFLKTYKYIREHDEWHCADEDSAAVKDIALEWLDKYLMRQH